MNSVNITWLLYEHHMTFYYLCTKFQWLLEECKFKIKLRPYLNAWPLKNLAAALSFVYSSSASDYWIEFNWSSIYRQKKLNNSEGASNENLSRTNETDFWANWNSSRRNRGQLSLMKTSSKCCPCTGRIRSHTVQMKKKPCSMGMITRSMINRTNMMAYWMTIPLITDRTWLHAE